MTVEDATMAIIYYCLCGERITTREERAGALEKCPACRMTVMVPDGPRPVPEKDQRRSA
jgi:hypothetical protein